MAKEPTYEELLMQNSLLKKQNKYLSEHTARVEKQNEKLTETQKQLSVRKKYTARLRKKLLQITVR